MQNKKQGIQVHWGSLSLRLSAFFVVVLVTAAVAIGYLFDRGRAEAVKQRKLEHLRLHAERGADELQRLVRQLQGDVLFLAGTPPIQGIRRALEADGLDRVGSSDLRQWDERLQQIFLSVAEARPEYVQLRLIGVADKGRELVRVERTENGPRAVAADRLQAKGERYYFREASRLEPGGVYLSRIDLNREHGQISVPHQPTLRAATPVQDPSGNLFGLVVVNMDMALVLARVLAYLDPPESLYLADERGDFLLHPEPGRAFAYELGTPYRLADAFPDIRERLPSALSGAEPFIELPGPRSEDIAYLTSRTWDPRAPERRVIFLLTEPADQALALDSAWPSERFLGVGALLSLTIVLVVLVVRRLTRSLSELAAASQAIGAGDYRVALPRPDDSEVGGLVRAFQRMTTDIEAREAALGALNRELEQRVDERTVELERAHSLQDVILENIADGVVVADREGRFLVWNAKAEQLIGSAAAQVVPERWSSHFGLFQDEGGKPVPTAELPLFRALQGESLDNVELYVRNPGRKEGRWAQVTARPLRSAEGEITGGVAVLVDVTEQKRLHKQLKSDRIELAKVARLTLSAGIASSAAHQLSQPIAAMSNYAGAAVRLLEQQRLGKAELLDILTRIENLAIQAGERLDELRALIRRRNQPAVPVDINQVADFCLQFLKDRIERLGVEVDRRYGHGLPQPRGDQIELAHLLIQLVSNALEALEGVEPGERSLSISTDHDQETGVVRIEVADSGPGVPPELARHLFALYPTDKPDALGVGLYIAKTIVDTYKGRIRMEKGELGAAVFSVELPVEREATA